MAELLENVIGSRRVAARTSETLEVLNPADGSALAVVPLFRFFTETKVVTSRWS